MDEEESVNYSVPDSVYDATRIEYSALKPNERDEHLKELWRLCFLKCIGASQIKRVFLKLHDRVINYGTTKNINIQVSDFERKILEKKSCIVLMPDDPIKRFWSILMIILLVYVVVWVPINICFFQRDPSGEDYEISASEIIDAIVDGFFGIDILINFISSYEDPVNGLPVVSLKKIAVNYLTSWFIIDFIAVIPTQIIEEIFISGESGSTLQGNQLKMVRLARLPRLYRLIRLLRMLKMLRVFRKSSAYKEWVNSLNISVGTIRMLNVLIVQFILVHLMACFWYMSATFADNIYETWVGHKNIMHKSVEFKYLMSFYWAFQTVTTVGYGDFTVSSKTEYILALIWMVVGVNFYSFTIGNVSSIIATMDSKAAVLNQKLTTLTEYSIKFNLPMQTQGKIKNFFENQAKTIGADGDWESLFNELPPSLRTDIVQSTHGQIIKGIRFFKDKPQDFLINVIPKLKSLSLFDNDILFSQGDQAEEIFFIFKGSVVHYVDLSELVDMRNLIRDDSCFNIPIAIYTNGSYFGDNDVLLQKNGYRTITAISQGDCQIYSIKSNLLLECLEKNEKTKKTMLKIAEEKNNYYQVLKDELAQKYKSKRAQEQIFNEKKDNQWTFYISLKRQMVKKQNALQNKLGVIIQNKFQSTKAIKDKQQREIEFKKQKAETKKLAQALGRKKVNHIHLNKYTDSLKNIIGKLHDENTTNNNAMNAQSKDGHHHDHGHTHDHGQGHGHNQENENSGNAHQHQSAKQYSDLLKATEGDSLERKEKLKVRLLNESQKYYKNNLNMFSNGLSLLAVNSLEVHGMVKNIHNQTERMQKLATNIEAHSQFMKIKSEERLNRIKAANFKK